MPWWDRIVKLMFDAQTAVRELWTAKDYEDSVL